MPKMTVLEIVQDILNDMTSDSVNSINDTVESQQIAQVVKTIYGNLVAEKKWPTARTLIQLIGLADSTKPNYMKLSDDIAHIDWIKYNKRTFENTLDKFLDVRYLEPKRFMDEMDGRDSSSPDVDTIVDFSGIPLYVRNDLPPTYWTSFNDEFIVFDSYDSGIDSTLQSSKSQAYALVEPSFTISDSFVPDMPAKIFPFLLSEAKSYCFINIKEQVNAKVEETNRRQRTIMARDKWRVNGGIKYPDYGRR